MIRLVFLCGIDPTLNAVQIRDTLSYGSFLSRTGASQSRPSRLTSRYPKPNPNPNPNLIQVGYAPQVG